MYKSIGIEIPKVKYQYYYIIWFDYIGDALVCLMGSL